MESTKQYRRIKRHRRVRGTVSGSESRPRFAVFRSNKHIFLQIIDDDSRKTLLGLGDFGTKTSAKTGKATKTESARLLGKSFAEEALKRGIKRVAFDRGGFAYHGRIKAVAEGAREGGLEF